MGIIIVPGATPYTSEYFAVGTGSTFILTQGNYFQAATSEAAHVAANRAYMSVENANIRFKLNTSAPATACGHLFVAGDYLTLDDVAQMVSFEGLNEGGTAAAYVQVTYFTG